MVQVDRDLTRLDAGDVDVLYTDMGNVLVNVDSERFFSRIAQLTSGMDRETFVRRVLLRPLYMDFARGIVDGPTFARALARELGLGWTYEEFTRLWVDMFEEIQGTEGALRTALDHVPVYILSNTDPVHMEYLLARFPWIGSVTGSVLSYDVGFLKPQPEFYLHALSEFGHRPERVLFVDDRPENVDAAREIGFLAVQMTDESVLIHLVQSLWGGLRA